MNGNTQLRFRLSKKADGTYQYLLGKELIDSVLVDSASQGFTELVIAADTTTKTAVLSTLPAKVLAFGDASDDFDGALSGEATAISVGATIGTASTTPVTVGGKVANLSELLDADGNEVLLADGTGVHVLLQTSGASGSTLTAPTSQVTFVTIAKDGVLTAVDVKAGTYGFEPSTVYSEGWARKLDINIAGSDGGLGSQNRDEIVALINGTAPEALKVTLTADVELSDLVVVMTMDPASGAVTIAESDTTAIGTAAETASADAKVFSFGNGEDTAGMAYKDGVKVWLNGNFIGNKSVTGSTDGGSLTIDFTQTFNGYNWLEIGDIIDVEYNAG